MERGVRQELIGPLHTFIKRKRLDATRERKRRGTSVNNIIRRGKLVYLPGSALGSLTALFFY
jgi:hypothetical protein